MAKSIYILAIALLATGYGATAASAQTCRLTCDSDKSKVVFDMFSPDESLRRGFPQPKSEDACVQIADSEKAQDLRKQICGGPSAIKTKTYSGR